MFVFIFGMIYFLIPPEPKGTLICKLFGHDFQPRTTEKTMTVSFKNINKATVSAEQYRRLHVRDVYVHDICVRCGKKVKK